MPWVKIVILSGHDEFEYAQSAIKLGVAEYLLKPINADAIQNALRSVATVLDKEGEERENLKQLQSQIKDNLTLRKERLLLQLVSGGVSSSEAIAQCRQIGLDIIAQQYLVLLIKVQVRPGNGHTDFAQYQKIPQLVRDLVEMHPGTFFTQKSVEELLLIMSGDDPEGLKQDGLFLANLIQQDLQQEMDCRVSVGMGEVQQRLTDISLSFAGAVTAVNQTPPPATPKISQQIDSVKIEAAIVEQYLKSGLIEQFDAFFAENLQAPGEIALQSTLLKDYFFVDLILTAAQFITSLDGDAHQIIPEMDEIEPFLEQIDTIESMRAALRQLFGHALMFRNEQVQYEKSKLIFQAKDFIDANYTDPNLLLNEVAATVNLSPSHFSVVFGRETGESFKDYLTRIRIERAKELLRTTNMKCSEVAYQSGYSDPHYFSYVFRKNTGLPPQQFRQLPQT